MERPDEPATLRFVITSFGESRLECDEVITDKLAAAEDLPRSAGLLGAQAPPAQPSGAALACSLLTLSYGICWSGRQDDIGIRNPFPNNAAKPF